MLEWYGNALLRVVHCSSPKGVSDGSCMPWFASVRLW